MTIYVGVVACPNKKRALEHETEKSGRFFETSTANDHNLEKYCTGD